jgi:hypothetical protein
VKPEVKETFINYYGPTHRAACTGGSWNTKQDADNYADNLRKACIKITSENGEVVKAELV